MRRTTTFYVYVYGLLFLAAPSWAATEAFSVLLSGTRVGHLTVEADEQHRQIDFDYKNNGRGPTIKESIVLGEDGVPTSWAVTGNSTFGNAIDESFSVADGYAQWRDSTGAGQSRSEGVGLYVAQSGSPWSLGVYARALMNAPGQKLAVLPGGELALREMERLEVVGPNGPQVVIAYALSGNELAPEYFLLNESGDFFASMSARSLVIQDGFEAEDARLRALSVKYSTERFRDIQARTAHNYDGPIRIRNVRVFDAQRGELTDLRTVVVNGNTIAEVVANESPSTPGETIIDGEGGTLIPGMYEMHGHLGQDDALLNIAAGITSVRDMGNNNAVLDGLVDSIAQGTLAGPRVIRSGFIEGKSPFNSNSGTLVSSESEALEAARFYGARGYYQIKIYNSMNPDWVPALVEEAKSLGMHVAGHVPAFSNADAMIAAGYDELTHINQVMLGWVLDEGEDTRTLLRLTALQRLPGLDLNSERVQKTINAMVEKGIAIDPTFAIHESLLLSRNGEVSPGMVDYVGHLPVGERRAARKAWSKIGDDKEDAAYREAFEQVARTIRMMHERGIFIVPGTDLGGSFAYHRELELYQQAGFTAAEILKRATYDMAAYLQQDQQLGSIEKGKLADFFLVPGDPVDDLKAIKTIRMVVKGGTVYFPSEIYPEFGIKPFGSAPKITPAPSDS